MSLSDTSLPAKYGPLSINLHIHSISLLHLSLYLCLDHTALCPQQCCSFKTSYLLSFSPLCSLCFTVKAVGKNKRVPQFDDEVFDDRGESNGVSEFADEVFDEIPVIPGFDYDVAEAEDGGDGVGSVEKISGLGFELEDDVFDESPVLKEDFVESLNKLKSCKIAMVKESCLGLEFEDHIVDGIQDNAKNRKFVAELEKNYDNSKVLQEVKIRSEISEKSVSSGIEFEESFVDEIQDKAKNPNFVAESEKNYVNSKVLQEVKIRSEIFEKGISSDIEFEENNMDQEEGFEGLGSEDLRRSENEGDVDESWLDEWEGIERTMLEKEFGDAVIFVGSKKNAHFISNFDNKVKMMLYGLHKVAIEGACCVQQPMALKVYARSKWNAWNMLGDISREVAMEQYIVLLSKSLPEWKRR